MWKLALIVLLISGCATSYKPEGITGGFTETRLSENAFLINVRGNGYTGQTRVKEIALLRSAELGLKNGYSYFVVLEDNASIESYNTSFGSSYNTTGKIYADGSFSSTTSGGPSNKVISKPGHETVVYFHKEKPNTNRLVYEVSFVCESLAPKFDTRCGSN